MDRHQIRTLDITNATRRILINGTLTDGRHYYMRIRGSRASIGIADNPRTAVSAIYRERPSNGSAADRLLCTNRCPDTTTCACNDNINNADAIRILLTTLDELCLP
jgi:hypothetical protein